MAKRLSIPILVKKVKISGTTQIQEQARALRLKALKALPEGEMIEAHHGDDQVETFLFRLFRGSGLHGLSSMKTKSTREGRLIWRPLLSATKDDLRVFAEANGIEFREDSSNRENKYDRNYIRNEVLPTIQKRFPKAKPAILRTIEQIQEEAPPEVFVETQNDSEWNWNELQGLKASELNRWLHEFFRSKFQVFLSRKQITELSAKIRSGTGFVFNAPKDIILRGRAKSRTVATPKIVILRKRG
jgi:tRNA(Ile)-lysidine synthase TilS/MesJ